MATFKRRLDAADENTRRELAVFQFNTGECSHDIELYEHTTTTNNVILLIRLSAHDVFAVVQHLSAHASPFHARVNQLGREHFTTKLNLQLRD